MLSLGCQGPGCTLNIRLSFHRWRARFAQVAGRDLWERRLDEIPPARRCVIAVLRTGAVVTSGFARHALTMRAGALTYITMFSLVPTLAVAFAMFSAFGGLTHARDTLLSGLMDYLATGVREQVASYVNEMLRNVHSGAIGATGFVFVIWAVFSLLSSIEDVFNEIWGVNRTRSYFERLTMYWTAVTVSPTLIVLGISLPSIVRQFAPLRWTLDQTGTGGIFFGILLPWAFVIVGFSFVYWFMISTRIPLTAALIGGISGGTLWFAAVHVYAWYVRSTVYYTSLYGSLAAVPIFIFWVWLSWLIVFAGAEVAFASQSLDTFRQEVLGADASQSARELLALRIMAEVVRRFVHGQRMPSAADLTAALQASGSLVNDITARLVELGLLVEFGEDRSLGPARDPHGIFPRDVVRQLRERGEAGPWRCADEMSRRLEAQHARAAEAADHAWGSASFADLAADSRGTENAKLPSPMPRGKHQRSHEL
jgi:membrane protein